jgi:cation transport ATPase
MATAERVTLMIHDLNSSHRSAMTIEEALLQVNGVTRVYVNHLTEVAYVEYDPVLVRPPEIAVVVRQVGFAAEDPVSR